MWLFCLNAIEAAHGPLAALRLPQVKFVQSLLPGESADIAIETLDTRRWRFRVPRDGALIASGELAAECETVVVARDSETGRPRPLTDAERAALEGTSG